MAGVLGTFNMGTMPGMGTPNVFPLSSPVVAHSGSFQVGAWQTGTTTGTHLTTYRGVAADVNDGGYGFHGMTVFCPFATAATVVSCTGFNTAPVVGGVPFNSIVRATGENLPVELMSFTAE